VKPQDTPAILIVDDHEANLRLYRAILQDAGAELLAVRSGAQAIALCAERSFAMVLLDVHLSDMSGFDVARALRLGGQGAASPIVFVSAVYTHEADTFRGYRLGAVDYILSPVVPEILRAKAAVFIGLQRLRSEAQAQTQAVDHAYRELRSAHTELEHFSFSVSHDLRTPLSQIAGFADLLRLQAGHALDAAARGWVDNIAGAAQRMQQLIDDLMALSRMTRAELRSETVDLSTLAWEVAGELNGSEPQRQVEWHVANNLQAQGDARLLRAAVANLLSNAWKYSAGNSTPCIEFGRIDQRGQAVFYVRDNGAGFDAQGAGDRLFLPFQRFHTDAAFEGHGVGLAIVQRVVVKHGGQIWAESAPGHGASFFFTLQAASNDAGPDTKVAA
jgi:signal transduction histidine kinase